MLDINLSQKNLLELLINAVNQTDVGVTIADARLDDMPLIFVNKAFEEMTGYPASEVIGSNCRFLQGDSRQEEKRKLMRESIEERRNCKVLLRNYRKNGEPFVNELHLSPILDDNGQLSHYVGVQHDVSEREELQEKLEIRKSLLASVNKKLKRLSDDKSRLLTTVAHDLRSPLAGIQGILEILKDEHDRKQQLFFIDQALQSIEKLNSLITDYLNYGAIEKGAIELNKEHVNLKEFATRLVDQYEYKARSKDITVTKDTNSLDGSAFFDEDRLEQCLDNIFGNALKYSERGSAIHLIFSSDDKCFNIEIKDEGIGIEKQDLNNLFNVFSKSSGETTEGESSFGVGLSIVKKIVNLHNGNVSVKSEWQKGTSFFVSIPLREK